MRLADVVTRPWKRCLEHWLVMLFMFGFEMFVFFLFSNLLMSKWTPSYSSFNCDLELTKKSRVSNNENNSPSFSNLKLLRNKQKALLYQPIAENLRISPTSAVPTAAPQGRLDRRPARRGRREGEVGCVAKGRRAEKGPAWLSARKTTRARL